MKKFELCITVVIGTIVAALLLYLLNLDPSRLNYYFGGFGLLTIFLYLVGSIISYIRAKRRKA
ncbi:hypothetical protein EP56_01870 [Listeriaceae bacterium FSL A5-0209]|nr:hypothetical protein EP58_07590 [Listeria newyorkensis]KGL46362.1 hypothetical protein EP56_01870 [Listeriaceae bacterium FSL A5-0209]